MNKYFLLSLLFVGTVFAEDENQEAIMAANSSLLYGAAEGNLKKVKRALAAKADINTKNAGTTALMYAAVHNHLDTIKYLVDQKADVSMKDVIGRTALNEHEEAQKRDDCLLTKAEKEEISALLTPNTSTSSSSTASTSATSSSGISTVQEKYTFKTLTPKPLIWNAANKRKKASFSDTKED